VMTRSDPATVAIRDQVVLDALREHPWSSTGMLSDRILEETGGPPTLITGALWIPAWTLYSILRRLEARGAVQRRQFSSRSILWAVAGEGGSDV
jgi:hypothetical protein